MNSYILSSAIVKRVYQYWVKREYTLRYAHDHWTLEWQHAYDQIGRMQSMYDSCDNAKITLLWPWHKEALEQVKQVKPA